MLETNPEFIKERQRLCCQKAKPFGTSFKIPQARLLSTYEDHYPPKWAHLDHGFYPEPQNKKQAFGLPDGGNVPKDSTYRDHYQGREGDPAVLADWPEGFKLQGPLADTTTYNVSGELFRTTIPIQETTTEWCPSLSGTKHPQAFPLLATRITEFLTRVPRVLLLKLQPGTTCTRTGTTSTRIEGQPTKLCTILRKGNPFRPSPSLTSKSSRALASSDQSIGTNTRTRTTSQ